MESHSKPLEDLETIRKIMEKSTRFLSLSGLSGVIAGVAALAGAFAAWLILEKGSSGEWNFIQVRNFLFMTAMAVLVVAIAVAWYLSQKRAQKQGQPMWTPVTGRMVFSLLVPLAAGAFFIFIFYSGGLYNLIIPAMLVFYGLALVNAGKFTFNEISYLGLCEVVTGCAAALIPSASLFLWAFGFGALHIFYGIAMFRKYGQ